LCLGIALPSAGSNPAAAAHQARHQVDVLFLSSLDPDLPDVAAMIEQTETRILDGSNLPVHFSFEYLDSPSSFADASRRQATAAYLLQKYSGQTFDLIIAINEETVAFTEEIQARLSPDSGLLFFVSNPRNPAGWLKQQRGRTGVVRAVKFLPTLELALRQNPGTSHVIVVSGASDAEKVDLKLAAEQFRMYESNLQFQYLTDLQFSDLGPRLAHLPPGSVIVFLDFITDSHGEEFVPARILPGIAKSSNAPIYGTFSSVVGEGVVGGSVADLGEVGRVLGDDGVRILKGERPENIPLVTGDFQHNVFDWRQLHRWGIAESKIPKESEVRYWEYSPWELYRWRILGLSFLLLIESVLIILLLVNIARRRRAQEALRRKEKELAEAQRLARVGNWFWDTRTDEFTWSEELYRIHGLDPRLPPPSHQQFTKLFTPESWSRLRAAIREASQTGSIQELDLELALGEGKKRWVTARGETLRDASGSVTCLQGTVQDISERKQAEEARSRLASIVESTDDAIISKNLDGVIVSWNRGAQRIFGYTAEEVIGKPIEVIIPDELLDEENRILRQVKRGERIEHYETVRITKAGERVNVSLTLSPVRDSSGAIIGVAKIARDITDRKRAEEALRESETRFRLIANTAPVLIWISGPDKLFNYFNQPWLEFTGRNLEHELGNGWTEGVHPDDLRRCMDTYTQYFDRRERFDLEYRLRRHDGEYRWVLDTGVPRVSPDGSFAGYVGCCMDISDLKQARATVLEFSGRLLRAGEEERARVARELHDDINQRLALLANGLQEAEATSANFAPQLKQGLRELWQLTNEIASSIQHISHHLHPSKLHYLGLAATMRHLCKEVAQQYKIEVECAVNDLPEDLEENVALNLFRVVQESLRNVSKHSHARHVKVELTSQSKGLHLFVSDDGVGFNPGDEDVHRGLGLVSMRERLRSVGGEFSIWSKPSLGTQVEAVVPIAAKSADRTKESGVA